MKRGSVWHRLLRVNIAGRTDRQHPSDMGNGEGTGMLYRYGAGTVNSSTASCCSCGMKYRKKHEEEIGCSIEAYVSSHECERFRIKDDRPSQIGQLCSSGTWRFAGWFVPIPQTPWKPVVEILLSGYCWPPPLIRDSLRDVLLRPI